MNKSATVYLKPCPKCGLPLKVDGRKRFAYCMNSHYSQRLICVSPNTKFVALSASAEEAAKLSGGTVSWRRLRKSK